MILVYGLCEQALVETRESRVAAKRWDTGDRGPKQSKRVAQLAPDDGYKSGKSKALYENSYKMETLRKARRGARKAAEERRRKRGELFHADRVTMTGTGVSFLCPGWTKITWGPLLGAASRAKFAKGIGLGGREYSKNKR